MKHHHTTALLTAAACLLLCSRVVTAQGTPYELSGIGYRATFSPDNGAIIALSRPTAERGILRSGEHGLWHVRFQDGSEMSAADFRIATATRHFSATQAADNSALRLAFESSELNVVVTATRHDTGIDLAAEITPRGKTVLEMSLPGRIRFEPDQLARFISPLTPHLGVGVALNRSFFMPQNVGSSTGWSSEQRGDRGYLALLGAGPTMHDWDAPFTRLRVTEAGRDWLGTALSANLATASARVNRPFERSQADLVLLDSDAGPYLAACSLGGTGHLWRVGGRVDAAQAADALQAVSAVIDKLAAAPGTRKRLALVNVTNGPAWGEAAAVTVDAWRSAMHATADAKSLQFAELNTPEAMVAAAANDEFLVILNPYGEGLPVPKGAEIVDAIEAIRRFVQAGGNWFEVGGYSFFKTMRPIEYLRFEGQYPPLFADYFHLDTQVGAASVYGVQPRTWQPWEGRQNHAALFVPGRLSFGGDAGGGWCEHTFGTFATAGQSWVTPRVRITVDSSPAESLRQYCQANSITRPLSDKLPASLQQAFQQAVLVKYVGTARAQIASLDKLPVPTLIHFTEYLKGGFDKEYPDHLPPSPNFGTPEELHALFDRAHALGHLLMPYTNPTWWCDHPRGPTFARSGDTPLLRRLDGSLSYERYGNNDGYTTCLWHPAVQAVNRETVRQFTEDYPVDILFQDQCGARAWQYDTNPASPTPYAYAEGMISMVEEDAQRTPLGTEDGFDRIVNAQVQLCGFTFGLVPGQNPSWLRSFKQLYPPSTWQIFPVAQHIAHDKAAMLHHDLGKFVLDRRTLSWTLGLGFAMSYTVRAQDLADPAPQQFLRWLDRVQKSICARYVGEPVQAFEHEQSPEASSEEGLIRATYGPVQLVANLGPDPRPEGPRELAGFGFYAEAPGLVAGNLRRLSDLDFGDDGISFVAETQDTCVAVWVYAAGGVDVAVLIPPADDATFELVMESQPPVLVRSLHNVVRLPLPLAPPPGKRLWHATLRRQ